MSESRVPVVQIQEPSDNVHPQTESAGALASSDSGYDEISTDFQKIALEGGNPTKVGSVTKSMAPDLETIQDGEDLEITEEMRSANLASKAINLPAGERVFHSMPDPTEAVRLLYAPDDKGNTSLHKAVDEQNLDKVLEIVQRTPDACYLNFYNLNYSTPLHIAAEVHFFKAAAMFLTRGANPLKFDSRGNTPFHIACLLGSEAMLQTLMMFSMDKGLKLTKQRLLQTLEVKNYEGLGCFLLAASSGNGTTLRVLSEFGVDVNAGDAKSGRTALHFAVEAGDKDFVTFLLKDIGVNVNSETFNGDTALTLARGRKLEAIVTLLEEYGGVESEETKARQAESECDSDMEMD